MVIGVEIALEIVFPAVQLALGEKLRIPPHLG